MGGAGGEVAYTSSLYSMMFGKWWVVCFVVLQLSISSSIFSTNHVGPPIQIVVAAAGANIFWRSSLG